MLVTVERHHIEAGVSGECALCPIALALNEQHPVDEGRWTVCNDYASIPAADIWYELPDQARLFVFFFDAGKACQPFAFELEEATCGD